MAYHWLDLPVRSGGVKDVKSFCEIPLAVDSIFRIVECNGERSASLKVDGSRTI